MKLLYITAHTKSELESKALQLGRHFINEYKKNNPDHEVNELNLYDLNIAALSAQDVDSIFAGEQNEIKKRAEEFAQADKYVFAAPMWNLSLPAKLHEYIDYISYVGTKFKYTENGPVGLLKNKQALHISTRGGIYQQGPGVKMEMGDRYLRTIIGFFGVEEFNTIELDGTNYYPLDKVEKLISNKKEEVTDFATKS